MWLIIAGVLVFGTLVLFAGAAVIAACDHVEED
jgi:hypothetical protein